MSERLDALLASAAPVSRQQHLALTVSCQRMSDECALLAALADVRNMPVGEVAQRVARLRVAADALLADLAADFDLQERKRLLRQRVHGVAERPAAPTRPARPARPPGGEWMELPAKRRIDRAPRRDRQRLPATDASQRCSADRRHQTPTAPRWRPRWRPDPRYHHRGAR